ncbi:hypothetical protein F5Y11DRAFT_336459 [Daldinia sp. FL1419]|nr:hypothetical protein F5Y11DRAFT_336459 [Daldinia sp. FL1419]
MDVFTPFRATEICISGASRKSGGLVLWSLVLIAEFRPSCHGYRSFLMHQPPTFTSMVRHRVQSHINGKKHHDYCSIYVNHDSTINSCSPLGATNQNPFLYKCGVVFDTVPFKSGIP